MRRTLGNRVARLAYFSLAVVVCVLAGFAVWSTTSTRDAGREVSDSVRESRQYEIVRLGLVDEHSALHEYILTFGPSAEHRNRAALRTRYSESVSSANGALQNLHRNDDDRDDAIAVSQLIGLHRRYSRLADKFFAAVNSGAVGRARTIDARQMDPIYERMIPLAEEAASRHRRRAAAALDALDRTQERAFVGTIVVFATGLVLLAGLGTLLELARRANEARRVELARTEAERQALDAQNEQLRELDRLKDDFVASVSHELRTPLTSIRGYLELVLEGEAGDLTDDQERFLKIVERNADRLLRVVGDLLFVAQVGAGTLNLERGTVDVEALAEQALTAARPAAEAKEIALNLDRGDVPELVGDAARIGQMLDNLVSNAIKFTPAGGHVDVRAFTRDGSAVIEVADTGIGIPAAEQARMFERFFRTTAATEQAIQGTGLGLAISKAVAEAHGGSIGFESTEGVGTTFRVKLPLERQAVRA